MSDSWLKGRYIPSLGNLMTDEEKMWLVDDFYWLAPVL